RLDQSGNHRLVFDDQHPPARAPDTRLSTARLGLPDPAAGIPIRLCWGAQGQSRDAKPAPTPPTGCHSPSNGNLQLNPSPPSSNSIFAFPPRPWLTSRSIKVRPKPCRGGLPTGGPPRSIQSKTRLVPLRLSTAQETSSDPPATDREPYFAEFVPSSWMIM